MRYIGQTGRPFKIRFREHLHDFKYKNGKSRFAQHLIDNGHSIGRMKDIMETLHITSKGEMMDALEKYYIFRETKLNNQINDKLTIKRNSIFDTIVRHDRHRGLPNAYSQDRQHPVSVAQEHHTSPQQYMPSSNPQQATHLHLQGPQYKINKKSGNNNALTRIQDNKLNSTTRKKFDNSQLGCKSMQHYQQIITNFRGQGMIYLHATKRKEKSRFSHHRHIINMPYTIHILKTKN